MNKKYFIQLANYTIWADQKVIGWLNQISDEQWKQVITSSFSSIEQTSIHIVSAEKIWLDFWINTPDPVYLSAWFSGSKNDLMENWKKTSAGWKNFIENYPEENYRRQITFRYPRGGDGQMEFWQTFSHIVNHSTYHRGQLVTLLRQAGFKDFSSIDLATYYFLHERNLDNAVIIP